jgi:putative peptidoglycan lipid II flippase
MFALKIAGIALATSISGIISTLVLFILLKKRIAPLAIKEIAAAFLRILMASIAMGVVCYFLNKNIPVPGAILSKIVYLLALVISGIASYIAFCFIFRVKEIHELRKWVFKKAL